MLLKQRYVRIVCREQICLGTLYYTREAGSCILTYAIKQADAAVVATIAAARTTVPLLVLLRR